MTFSGKSAKMIFADMKKRHIYKRFYEKFKRGVFMKKRIALVVLAIIMLLNVTVLASSAAMTPGKPAYGKASGYGSNFTLTGNHANDVITVAKAQVYKKGKELGYSSAWCDAFVVDCARIANVPTSVIPNKRGCKALYDAIISKGGVKVTTPKAGDVVLYYCKTCKNYPHIGFYAGNNYTCEGNVGGSVSNSNRKKVFYCDGSGHASNGTIQSLYVRPNYANSVIHTINYNANSGSGSMASEKVAYGSQFSLAKNSFTYKGYDFAGWNVKRSDGKWYCASVGWKTESEIAANGYTKSLYSDAWTGTFNTSWTDGTSGAISVTFYAQWKRSEYIVNLWNNYSEKNYLNNSDFRNLDTTLYKSRNESVYTVSVDKGRTSDFGAMKIVGVTAGSSGKDLLWRTATMGNSTTEGYIGDNKTMTLSFWAKSSVEGAKFYTRFGYQGVDKLKSITLSTDWKYHTITLTKDKSCGTDLHPYFDKAGTFLISELQLEDGNVATAFTPENGTCSQMRVTSGQKYSSLPIINRNGYSFDGWYTAANGGTKINADTDVVYGNLNLYAHWSVVEEHTHSYSNVCDEICNTCGVTRSVSHTYTTTTTKATLTANGKIVEKCNLCGDIKSTEIIYSPKTITLSKTAYTYNGKVQTPTVTVEDSKGKTLKNGTDYTVKYENGRIQPGRYNVKITFKGKYSGVKRVTYTIAPKCPSKVIAVQSTSAIKLTWSKSTGATGYRVYQYNAKTKTWDKIKTTTATSFKVENLKAGTTYKYRIKCYKDDAGLIWGKATSTIAVATKPATPKITAVASTAKGRAAVAWTNVAGETGYELYASTKKDTGYKKIVTAKANVTKGVKTGLVSGRTYYFKVRAYKTVGNTVVYSALSAPQALKIK